MAALNDWHLEPLQNLTLFQKGKKVYTSEFSLEHFQKYLGASSLTGGEDGFAAKDFAVLANCKDVLMLWDGERSGLVGYNLEGVVSSTVTKLTPNNKIIPIYLYYYLQFCFDWIQGRRTGTGVPHVPKDIGKILKVYYPINAFEQNRISAILSTVDINIEKTEALIQKYQKIKAGLMHDLFTRGITADGKLRPPREQVPELYQETSVGWIPKDWVITTINTITESLVDGPFGSNLKTEHYVSDPGIRVVRLQNITATKYNDSDKAYISDKHAEFLIRNKVFAGDILVAGLGEDRYPVGRACLYPENISQAINKADCFRLRCHSSEMLNAFLMFYLNTHLVRPQIKKYEQGVTRPRINTGNLKKVILPKPPINEQTIIVNRLMKVIERIDNEFLNKEKLLIEKQGLMQDLLTGKVRVKLEEAESA